MDDYKKIPFDDPDLCVPDLGDFDQMKARGTHRRGRDTDR